MNYKIVDMDNYYRKGVYRHFSEDCKCSTSITNKIDVTELIRFSKDTNTKFYINFLYLLCKVLNSREDYRTQYLFDKQQVVIFDKINPTHYIFHNDTETCTVVYSEYYEDYSTFYNNCSLDIAKAKETREYGLDEANHPNWFDASYISWISYESLNIELPDGYLYFMPIINWGRYSKVDDKFLMPVSVRLNHAIADGYLVANVFVKLNKAIKEFIKSSNL